jgi:hypothetical protein
MTRFRNTAITCAPVPLRTQGDGRIEGGDIEAAADARVSGLAEAAPTGEAQGAHDMV